ncbi:MAG: Na+/H+ antiporter NhaA [Gammaproteobacteria bacterium]
MSTQDPRLDHIEKTFERILTPFEHFLHRETAGGVVLMTCTVIALVLANSPLVGSYEHLLHIPMGFSFGETSLVMSLHHWINDGLMTLFFFVVGLEIKREVLVGELSRPKQAALPIVAAMGGMVVPALLYFAINPEGPTSQGWGVPMATDIAFAVGVMVLLGKRVPPSMFAFLVALAIVDDLGAVAVIAIFYTDNISLQALFASGLLLCLLVLMNIVGIRRPMPYFIVGLFLWLAMHASGIHATVAGVLTAWTIPARPKFSPEAFSRMVQGLMARYNQFARREGQQDEIINNMQQRRAIVQTLENGVHMMETPLQRLEYSFHTPVAFLVIPIFALANAGVPIDFAHLGTALTEPVALGVMVGLIFGKLIGIAGASLLAIKLGLGEMPKGASRNHIIGVALLGGIGFTMSIFISELGFKGHAEMLLSAKTGILFASLIAGVLGYLILRFMTKPAETTTG